MSYTIGTGRYRTVKPELFQHEELFEAEAETGLPLRLSFIGLFCQADRAGRFQWKPRTLKARVLPFDDGVDFARVLDALATRGFIVRYTSRTGDPLGWIPTFEKHQFINNRERESELDPYDPTREPRDVDASATRDPRQLSRKDRIGEDRKDLGEEGVQGGQQPAASGLPAATVEEQFRQEAEAKRRKSQDRAVKAAATRTVKEEHPEWAEAIVAIQMINDASGLKFRVPTDELLAGLVELRATGSNAPAADMALVWRYCSATWKPEMVRLTSVPRHAVKNLPMAEAWQKSGKDPAHQPTTLRQLTARDCRDIAGYIERMDPETGRAIAYDRHGKAWGYAP